jgi:hypothetical protein
MRLLIFCIWLQLTEVRLKVGSLLASHFGASRSPEGKDKRERKKEKS